MAANTTSSLLLVLLLSTAFVAFFADPVSSMYFFLEEGQSRCFIEEVPKDTLVVGKYTTEDGSLPIPPQGAWGGQGQQQQQDQRMGVKVSVTDQEGTLILQRDMNPDGRFAFTSQAGGEHHVCFQTNSSRWFAAKKKLKFHLEMETGESAVDYEELAKQEHFSALEVSIRRLSDRLRDIRAEQNYQRNREAVFRNTSESTNSRVVWWSVVQTLILVATGMWQISHLKNFFKTKKLV